jgi:hypothetical protein
MDVVSICSGTEKSEGGREDYANIIKARVNIFSSGIRGQRSYLLH